MKTLLSTVLSITLGIGLLPGMAAAAGKPLYRWVDEQGRVHYGDKIPPVAAKREIGELDNTGRVRAVRPRELTADEAKAAEAANLLAKQQEQQRKITAAHDKSLLDTYDTVQQLEHARDEQLSLIDQRLLLTQKSVADSEAALSREKAGFASITAPSAAQKKQLGDAEQALAEARNNHSSLLSQLQNVERKFASDIARFKALKGSPG